MRKIYFVGCLLAAIFALSCNANQEAELAPPPVNIQFEDQNQFIEKGLAQLQLSDAQKVAQRFMFNSTKKQFAVSAVTRADQMTAVRDSLGNPLMYVVNFEQGGFCIVSATKKSYPILAHSESGFFDLEKVGESGVCLWLEEMEYGIARQDTLSEEERIFLNSAWSEYEKGFDMAETRAYGDMNDPRYRAFSDRMGYHMSNGSDPIPLNGAIATGTIPDNVISGAQYVARNAGCPEEYVIILRINDDDYKSVGPLLKTEWHQRSPYNNSIPKINNTAPPAGCVAIAMGQIMMYHKWPARYNWANMVGSYVSTKPDAANFIYQVGLAVNMDYGVGGSGSTIDKAKSAFKSDFGYDAVILKDFPQSEILNNNRPYYARGRSAVDYIWGFPVEGGGGRTRLGV